MMNFFVFAALLFFYFIMNIYLFNFLKNYKKYLIFISIFLTISAFIFVTLKFNYIHLYIILILFCIISFKFFSYLFFENSPTLYLCKIVKKHNEYEKIKKAFLLNIFIKKYLDNLINSRLIRIQNDKLILEKNGKYFFLFFKYFFRFLFK
jgi:hypothetical protein